MLAAAPLTAQPASGGGEFQVNTYTTNFQSAPAVALDAQGDFVVVWHSLGSNGPDLSDLSIQAQRYSANGQPAGGEFQVNLYGTANQYFPDVASASSGDFVVVWQSDGSFGTDTDGSSVQGRRFAADGTPLGNEFQINTYTTGPVRWDRVAANATGDFVVVWASLGSAGTDSADYSIQARRYSADGTPLGGQFQVNSYTTGAQIRPDVAIAANGAFVVVWESFGSAESDQDLSSVQARRYAADGTPQGSQFQVNGHTTSLQGYPGVASDAERNFVVVWGSQGSFGTDDNGFSVQARLYSAAGTPQGGQFQVNSYTSSNQGGFLRGPSVAANESRDFTVFWGSDGSARSDTSGDSVQARWYAGDGTPRTNPIQVNNFTTGDQNSPRVGSDPRGNIVLAWSSQGSFGTDSSSYSIQARRWDGLFRDGFETGDSSRWTQTVP